MNRIIIYKNRTINKIKPVYIYRNLHNHLLSIKQNNVVGHSDLILLKNINFVIHQSGHQKTIKEKSKNVHAFVKGYLYEDEICFNNAIQVFYNPYKASFFRSEEDKEIISADYIKIYSDGRMFVINPIFKL